MVSAAENLVAERAAEPARAAAVLGRVVWIGAILAAAAFFVQAAAHYFVFTEASYRLFWPNRYPILLHVIGGSTALCCGLLQFCTRVRERYRAVHRWTGRCYLAAVAIGVTSAWYMSFHAVLGWTVGVATFFLGVAWLVTTAMAYVAIRRRQLQAHREWMIRSYVVTFAFVFFRMLFASPLLVHAGTMSERVTALLWISFMVPPLMTELVLQWRRTVGARRS
jgi:Predicted membrane protein (DUF2306)